MFSTHFVLETLFHDMHLIQLLLKPHKVFNKKSGENSLSLFNIKINSLSCKYFG